MYNDVWIVIPVYNEASVIKKVIDDIQSLHFKNIIVVDDGSKDNTLSKLTHKNIIIASHLFNRGKGSAIKTGIAIAKIHNCKYVITIDGDGQHEPLDLIDVYKNLKKGYDVILGSRFLCRNNIPLHRRIGNYVSNIITYLIYGIYVTDSQSGLRGFSKKALEAIHTRSERYEYESEVISEIERNKLTYIEIPISVLYTTYAMHKQNRQNLANAFKTIFKIITS